MTALQWLLVQHSTGSRSKASRSEVHGTHLSDDLMRMLPSELLNLEDEALEHLFYARLLEKRLQTYELSGTTQVADSFSDEVVVV